MSQPIQRGAGPDPPDSMEGGRRMGGCVRVGWREGILWVYPGVRGKVPPIDGPKGWESVGVVGEPIQGCGQGPPQERSNEDKQGERRACSGTLYNCCCRVIPGY